VGPRDRPHLTPQRLPPPFAATVHSVTKRRVPLGGTLRPLTGWRAIQRAGLRSDVGDFGLPGRGCGTAPLRELLPQPLADESRPTGTGTLSVSSRGLAEMDPDAQSTSATPTEVMEHRPWPGSTGSTSEISTKRCRRWPTFWKPRRTPLLTDRRLGTRPPRWPTFHKEPHPQTACFLSWSRKDVQLVSVGS
jgi:hypothetical protein